MKQLLKVGLTGGIAAGKSTVAARWREAGAELIDTDELAHQALAPGTASYNEIVDIFGAALLRPDQSIDRRRLGEIVFADEQKRRTLNQIVHPVVRRKWTEKLAAWEQQGRSAIAVVAIPLLYEVGAEAEFDCVVVVACSEETQLARLTAKSLTPDQARARIRAQWPMQKKMDKADYVIWNDGSLRVLSQQADRVWATIKENHHAPKTQGSK